MTGTMDRLSERGHGFIRDTLGSRFFSTIPTRRTSRR